MRTDYHCHILPALDDGAKDVQMSLAMIEMMRHQGVERIIATPHFYAHREKSVEDFLVKRQAAFERIREQAAVSNIILGAEVLLEHGISEWKDVEKLAVQGTDWILLELPYRRYEQWMEEEIYHISTAYHLKVVLAHIHRYLHAYSKEEMCRILKMSEVLQINNEAFESFSQRNFVKSLIKDGYTLLFGSDAHNLTERKPNWNVIVKKCKKEIIEQSDAFLKEPERGNI